MQLRCVSITDTAGAFNEKVLRGRGVRLLEVLQAGERRSERDGCEDLEVGKEGVDAKIKALSMYRGVMRPYPHTRSTEALEGFAAYRGCQAGCNYAEAFEVILRRQ